MKKTDMQNSGTSLPHHSLQRSVRWVYIKKMVCCVQGGLSMILPDASEFFWTFANVNTREVLLLCFTGEILIKNARKGQKNLENFSHNIPHLRKLCPRNLILASGVRPVASDPPTK